MLCTHRYLISGRVQGVGFRWATVDLARRLHVTGTVENLATGQVLVIASGSTAILTKFQARLAHVNPWARVTAIEMTELPPRHFTDFHVNI